MLVLPTAAGWGVGTGCKVWGLVRVVRLGGVCSRWAVTMGSRRASATLAAVCDVSSAVTNPHDLSFAFTMLCT